MHMGLAVGGQASRTASPEFFQLNLSETFSLGSWRIRAKLAGCGGWGGSRSGEGALMSAGRFQSHREDGSLQPAPVLWASGPGFGARSSADTHRGREDGSLRGQGRMDHL